MENDECCFFFLSKIENFYKEIGLSEAKWRILQKKLSTITGYIFFA